MRGELACEVRSVPDRTVHALVAAGALLACFACAERARADVIEITPDGEVRALTELSPPSPRLPTSPPGEFKVAGDDASLSPDLIAAVAWTESHWNQDARSPAGAQGIMQLMPDTAAALGVDPSVRAQNLRGGAAYLRQMLNRFDGNLTLALAAYNAGPAAVERYGSVPPYRETQAYVAAVLTYLAEAAGQEEGQ